MAYVKPRSCQRHWQVIPGLNPGAVIGLYGQFPWPQALG
jgi:hypothetical protein